MVITAILKRGKAGQDRHQQLALRIVVISADMS
jgi:hypothetical protein